MHYLIITDCTAFAATLARTAPEKEPVTVIIHGRRSVAEFRKALPKGCAVHRWAQLRKMAHSGNERVMVALLRGAADVLGRVRARFPHAPALVVAPAALPKAERERLAALPHTAVVDAAALARPAAQERWKLLDMRKRIARMRAAADPARPLWILTQNDPDPDAIGSALALTHLLGRSRRNTPIVTLKRVSRSENLSMIGLLGITVKTVTRGQLARAPQLALVDVQPSYFKFPLPSLRIVVDHHPRRSEYDSLYVDIQPDYGATSSILAEYLDAAGLPLNTRLATALFYAVKTDTLLFGRGISHDDLRVFSALWPLADHQLVSQMERPRLKTQELDVFIHALRKHCIERGALFAPLGAVHKEDLVPRLADFVLQIGEAEFALVWGRYGRTTTFSARALNPRIDAGETMRLAFGHLGSAGGHTEMARATMPTAALAAEFGARNQTQLAALIKRRVLKIITAQKRAAPKRQ